MFRKLQKSLLDAIEYEKGNMTARAKQIIIPEAPKTYSATAIKKLRVSIGVSQRDFALWLNVSLNTVKAWEQGLRNPSHSALRLLEVFEKGFSHIQEMFDIPQEKGLKQATYRRRPAYLQKGRTKDRPYRGR